MKKFTTELIRTTIYTAYIVVTFFLLFSILTQEKRYHTADNQENHITLSGTVTIDGNKVLPLSDALKQKDFENTLVFNGHFNKEISEGKSLIFKPNNLRIKLYVNGVLKLSIGEKESFPSFINYAGTSYQSRYLGEIKTEDVIMISLEKVYALQRTDSIPHFFHQLYIAKDGDLYRDIIQNRTLHPIVGMSLYLFGFNFLIVTLVQQLSSLRYLKRVFYLSFLCIGGGICYLADSVYEFIDLLFPHPVFNTLVDFGCFPVFLILSLLFFSEYVKDPKRKRICIWMLRLYTAFTIMAFFLQSAGLIDLYLTHKPLVIIGTGFLFVEAIYMFYERKTKEGIEHRYILIAVSFLLTSLLFKSVGFLFSNEVDRSHLRIGILTCYLTLLFYKMRAMKQNIQLMKEQEEMKEELQKARTSIMLSQIKPHFLYNSLNIIEHICSKNSALASEALLHFSHYLRGNMDSLTKEDPIPFAQELHHISHYVYMEQLRFGERVKVNYKLEYTEFCLPTLTLQPLVENAIRHGITKKAEGGTVTIKTLQTEKNILIIVSDDGIGFQTDAPQSTHRSHIGLSNVKKRLKLQCNGTLRVKSTPGIGTIVTIILPKTGESKNESNSS